MQLPARSTLAGGLVGLAGWAIVTFALPALGIAVIGPEGISYVVLGQIISAKQMMEGVTALVVAVFHYVPDSLKTHAAALDVDIKDLAKIMPGLTDEFPGDPKPASNTSNINRTGR